MDPRDRVHDALEALTSAVAALGEALREAGITGEESTNGSEPPRGAGAAEDMPFVPVLIPMDVLRSWGAQATPAVAENDGDSPDPAQEVSTAASPAAAPRGLTPPPAPDASTPPQRGTWVWTWEHPVEEENEGDG
jgi:hypothetical protein